MSSVVKGVTGAIGSVGKMLGIGGGNTPEFDPSRANYDPKKEAYAANNRQQALDLSNVQNTANQRIAGIDEKQARAKQTSLASALEASANGVGPSLAQNQLKQATNRNLASQMAFAAAGHLNPALSRRLLAQQQAQTNQTAAAQSGDLRLQEQNQARAQLGEALNSQRTQDQQSVAANTATELGAIQGQQGINDQNRAAQMQLEAQRSSNATGVANAMASDAASRRENNSNGLGSALGAAGSALSFFSDERLKKDVHDGSHDVAQFLDAIDAKSFKYKDQANGKGERMGVMAQDVEQGGPLGKQMVNNTPEGKMIDISKGFGAILASQAELNKRLKALETKKKK